MTCTDRIGTGLQRGDIVQVFTHEDPLWVGCLFIIDELKSWGIQGFLHVPAKGDIWMRLKSEDIIYSGRAILFEREWEDEATS